jgi:hypothetical protein
MDMEENKNTSVWRIHEEPGFPVFRYSGRFCGIRHLLWRIRYRKKIKEYHRRNEKIFQDVRTECERLCEEAFADKEKYGERPLLIDWGNGVRVPVPLSSPDGRWDIGIRELKDGTLVPVAREIKEG